MPATERIWTRWTPNAAQPWNLRRVVHLHRRVGFAANWSTLQRDLRDSPDSAIDRLLNPSSPRAGSATPAESSTNSSSPTSTTSAADSGSEFESMADVIGNAAVGSDNSTRLKAWWLYRMLLTPDPLGERLALMWHNHFATSNLKVSNLTMMRRQNELFREFARRPFGDLLHHIAKDPATLVWLDADANRKEHPNENLAREIMELFTLGVGNYSETDVREAARALTGWTVKDNKFREVAQYHDNDPKTLFEKTGNWTGDDLVQMLLDHPATSKRLAARLCGLLMGEKAVSEAALQELARFLRDNSLDIGKGIETIVRSELFFADQNIGNRVTSPIEFVISAIRSLERTSPLPSTLLLAETTTGLGQDLFYPPNVFGWPGGRSWLTTRSLISRANFAAALVDGSLFKPTLPFDIEKLAARYDFAKDRIPEFLGGLLGGMGASSPFVDQLVSHLQAPNPRSQSEVVVAFLTAPISLLG